MEWRIDDIGASTKQLNQYGKTRIYRDGKLRLYFPFANFWFFKRIEPFRQWAPYEEVGAPVWSKVISLFQSYKIVPIVAITACWVEPDGTQVPFPIKFPEQAQLLREEAGKGHIVVANHGLTHCVVGKHNPRMFTSNRKFHREFWPDLPASLHDRHISESQSILEGWLGCPIRIFVPPGNVWSVKTYDALKRTAINRVIANRYMLDCSLPMEGIEFSDDTKNFVCFHDREISLFGPGWLEKKLVESNEAFSSTQLTI